MRKKNSTASQSKDPSLVLLVQKQTTKNVNFILDTKTITRLNIFVIGHRPALNIANKFMT